jgi:hypothetical protein
VEGTAQQAKGKVQRAWGNMKEGAKNAQNDAERKNENEAQRKQEHARSEHSR